MSMRPCFIKVKHYFTLSGMVLAQYRFVMRVRLVFVLTMSDEVDGVHEKKNKHRQSQDKTKHG